MGRDRPRLLQRGRELRVPLPGQGEAADLGTPQADAGSSVVNLNIHGGVSGSNILAGSGSQAVTRTSGKVQPVSAAIASMRDEIAGVQDLHVGTKKQVLELEERRSSSSPRTGTATGRATATPRASGGACSAASASTSAWNAPAASVASSGRQASGSTNPPNITW